MVRYIPTHDGKGIVSLLGQGTDLTCCEHNIPISTAERLLKRWREDAWEAGLRGSPNADLFLKWANDLNDALAYAGQLRRASGARRAA